MASIYLAGAYATRTQLVRHAARLEGRGHKITSRWLLGETEECGEWAVKDMEDVQAAEVLMLFTNPRGTMYSGGGRMVEFGMAAAWGKRLMVVGEREMIFCHLPKVEVYDTFDLALEAIWTSS